MSTQCDIFRCSHIDANNTEDNNTKINGDIMIDNDYETNKDVNEDLNENNININQNTDQATKLPRGYDTLDGFPEVKGYDFNQKFDFQNFIDAYKHMGIQGTNLGYGIEIINQMIEENVTIFLSATSNQVSCGNRDIIRYLVEHKMVHVISVSEGAVEEDIIKCLKPFVIGTFDISGRALFDKNIGRIGNIFAPGDRYAYFETFTDPFFDRVHKIYKDRGVSLTPSEFIYELGREMERLPNKEESYIYWAYKNDIPVFCPALVDGTFGNFLYAEHITKKGFPIDIVADHKRIIDIVLGCEKSGAILLGGGTPKHYVLNANIYRDGLDYAVYITTADEHDASDSGGNPQEAISWAKIKVNGLHVKIRAEASIVFPLIVAGSFARI